VFGDGDLAGEPSSVIVNTAFAAEYWPGESGLGRSLLAGGRPMSIVGVVGDVKVQTLGEAPTPMVYLPLASGHASMLRLIVRTSGDPSSVIDRLERDIAASHPTVAIVERRTMAENVGLMLLPYELGSLLGLWLGAAAVALSGVGLYGLVAFAVASRTREFGVRLALGASGWQMLRTATAEVLGATAAGILAGLLFAAVAARGLTGYVVGISALDATAFAAAVALTAAVAAAATIAPARRALRIDPIAPLRAD
jgi:predicted lysophospholipase L1 biosynthesis ABC-type transport system permease subunit